VAELLGAHGTEVAKARRVASALVDADRCGHSSHGVRQLPYYLDLIARGSSSSTPSRRWWSSAGA
jgi:LDH2 family malate/lactate/ureidoglycolate dehydrogenase